MPLSGSQNGSTGVLNCPYVRHALLRSNQSFGKLTSTVWKADLRMCRAGEVFRAFSFPFLAGLGAVAVFYPISLMAQPSPNAQHRIAPAGLYSSWSAEDRERVPGNVRFACAFGAMMGLGSYSGPKDLGVELTLVQTFICILEQMPVDWPDRSQAREQALKHFEAARHLDGSISIPDIPN